MYIVEERQRSRCPRAAGTRRAHGDCGRSLRCSSSTMCIDIASSSRLELASQAPCARPLLILGQAPRLQRQQRMTPISYPIVSFVAAFAVLCGLSVEFFVLLPTDSRLLFETGQSPVIFSPVLCAHRPRSSRLRIRRGGRQDDHGHQPGCRLGHGGNARARGRYRRPGELHQRPGVPQGLDPQKHLSFSDSRRTARPYHPRHRTRTTSSSSRPTGT